MSYTELRLIDPPPDVEVAPLYSASSSQNLVSWDKPSNSSTSIFASIKGLFADAWRDIRAVPRYSLSQSRRLWWQFIASTWISLLVALLFYLSFWMTSYNNSPCRSDGDFNMKMTSEYDSSYLYYAHDLWAFKGLLDVNLSWGNFEFATAKLIDVAWDLVVTHIEIAQMTMLMKCYKVVGRGGQAIMSFVAWNVFTEYLEVSIATQPATYTTIWLLRFYQSTSLWSTIQLVSQFFRRRLASKAATCIMVLTLLFVLAFPTIAGSMTGYTPSSEPYIALPSGSLISFSSAVPIAYIIHDGNRTKMQQNDYIVPWVGDISQANKVRSDLRFRYCSWRNNQDDCELQEGVSKYVRNYGFNRFDENVNKLYGDTTEFLGQKIAWPPLNISKFGLPPTEFYYGTDYDPNTNTVFGSYQGQDISYIVGGEIYNSTQLVENGSCQPVNGKNSPQRYRWGFSFLQLYIVTVVLIFWSLALFTLWKPAHDALKISNHEITSRDWRGLLDFADTIRRQIKQASIDIDNLSDDQLEKEIQTVLRGGSISSPHMSADLFSIPRWLWAKKWWIVLSTSVVLLTVAYHIYETILIYSDWVMVYMITLLASSYLLICLFIALATGADTGARIETEMNVPPPADAFTGYLVYCLST
ncbi:hypothetical protein FLONG3_2562 [Fusarium longipes]|uniref:Uncharacterized protein n=1 Tax=Fusarium longipes TaxID=694270 RepID=A0A395T3N4_9HYPO|nr:hypothetical protein FLONG3_2562 [Fusarium longipes]